MNEENMKLTSKKINKSNNNSYNTDLHWLIKLLSPIILIAALAFDIFKEGFFYADLLILAIFVLLTESTAKRVCSV